MISLKRTKIKGLGWLIFLALFSAHCSTNDIEQENAASRNSSATQYTRLFDLVPPETSGVTFRNVLTEDADINLWNFNYLYNGSGVAIGDLNNDGLPDIYFTGNMVANALYLNTGDMVFEDITASAGVDGGEGWCTGTTMADVNGDGYLDIYVCRSYNDSNPELRTNLLYINNGDLTFNMDWMITRIQPRLPFSTTTRTEIWICIFSIIRQN